MAKHIDWFENATTTADQRYYEWKVTFSDHTDMDAIADLVWDDTQAWYRRLEGQVDTKLFLTMNLNEITAFVNVIEVMIEVNGIKATITDVAQVTPSRGTNARYASLPVPHKA